MCSALCWAVAQCVQLPLACLRTLLQDVVLLLTAAHMQGAGILKASLEAQTILISCVMPQLKWCMARSASTPHLHVPPLLMHMPMQAIAGRSCIAAVHASYSPCWAYLLHHPHWPTQWLILFRASQSREEPAPSRMQAKADPAFLSVSLAVAGLVMRHSSLGLTQHGSCSLGIA